MEDELPLRSRASIYNVLVLFVNKTQRDVSVFWVDYEGIFKKLITLKPNEEKSTNTYSTHPWVFKDATTGERMHVDNHYIYWPKPLILVDNINNNHRVKRRRIEIHFPLRSLFKNAAWIVAKHLQSVDDIQKLEIPNILTYELKEVYHEHEIFKKKLKQL